ncbi:MAG TPA: hypothetical protein VIF62_03565, partial [Labilithrix sp.]
AASPTYSKTEPNPCSQLTVPQGAPASTSTVQGVVKLSGAPVPAYLVVLERMEPSSHHFFVDRATTAADGKLMLRAAAGTYRLQVLHPTYYSKTDAQRTPDDLGAVRRTLSSAFTVDKDVTLDAAEVSYGGYAAMSPRGSATLPLTMEFSLVSGAAKAQAAIYGPGGEIGDPWWTSSYGTATSATFDGGWDTKQAPDGGIDAAATYYWGTEQIYAASDGGVQWTGQSMVFPVQLP